MHKLKGTTVKSISELTHDELDVMCKKKRSILPGVNSAPTRVYVSDMLLVNPDTKRLVKSDGIVGKKVQRQQGGGKSYLPNTTLVKEYNKLHNMQRTVEYRDNQVVLYAPQISDKSLKKLKVYVEDPDTGEIKRVDFGHSDYEDFTIHRDSDRRRSYCARSGGIHCKGKECGVDSANYWSRMVLWDCD
jgi:hypothetical protein